MKKFKKAFLCGSSKYSEDDDDERFSHTTKLKSAPRSKSPKRQYSDKGKKSDRNGGTSCTLNGSVSSGGGDKRSSHRPRQDGGTHHSRHHHHHHHNHHGRHRPKDEGAEDIQDGHRNGICPAPPLPPLEAVVTNGHAKNKKNGPDPGSNPLPGSKEEESSESDTSSSTTTSETSSSYTLSGGDQEDLKPRENGADEFTQPDTRAATAEPLPDSTAADVDGDLTNWEYQDISLRRNGQGLGFSISGGVDNHVAESGTDIIVTKLIPGGTAIKDGRLKPDDVILSVNDVDVRHVTHEEAVEALKRAGSFVRLKIKRRTNEPGPDLHYITLKRGNLGLGFSISGGIDNEHIPDDPSIYVTKIILGGAADVQGQLRVGDKLLKVNDIDLAAVTHEDAVLTLKTLPNDEPVHILVSRVEGEIDPESTDQAGMGPVNGEVEASLDQVDRVMEYMSKSVPFNPTPGGLRVDSPLITELKEKLRSIDAKPPNPRSLPNQVMACPLYENFVPNGLPSGGGKGLASERSEAISHSSESSNAGGNTDDEIEDRLKNSYPGELIRKVVLTRGPRGLGFNIVGGEEFNDNDSSHDSAEYGTKGARIEYGIYVSHVVPGGAAHLAGNIGKGDQILAVNGNELTEVSHDEAAHVLKAVGDTAILYLVHKAQEFEWYESRMNQVKEKTPANDPPSEPEQRTITSSVPPLNVLVPNSEVHNSVPAAPPGSLKTSQKRSIYVRALYDYDPAKDKDLPNRGLEFNAGDILHVINASDEEWWQARKCNFTPVTLSATGQEVWFDKWPPPSRPKVTPTSGNPAQNEPDSLTSPPTANKWTPSPPWASTESSFLGLIPSKKRVERKERIRNKSVKFRGNYPDDPNDTSLDSNKGGGDKKRKNFSFTKKFPFMKSKEFLLNDETGAATNHVHTANAGFDFQHSTESMPKPSESELSLNRMAEDQHILSYQQIVPKPLPYTRPVIILGPFKDRINDDLINDNPDKYGSCVPHTTRSQRDYEVDGRDYHFVPSVKEMESSIQSHLFIEAGQYNGNLYGTSVAAVKEIAQSGKHCVLDVSGNAIRRLIAADIYPIVIYIKPESSQALMALNDKMTEPEAIKACEKAQKIEQDFSPYFTGVIMGKSFEDIHSQVLRLIEENSDINMWVVSQAQAL